MVGIRLIQIAAVYLVVALVLGVAMGISGDFSLMSVHAHLSLLGWATMALTGVIYILMPGCARSRLAGLHFWGHNIGLPVMMASLALVQSYQAMMEPVIAASSMLVLVSLVFFMVNVFRNATAKGSAHEYSGVGLETKVTVKTSSPPVPL